MPSSGLSSIAVRAARVSDLVEIDQLRTLYYAAMGREKHPFPFECDHFVSEDGQGVSAFAARTPFMGGFWFQEFFRAPGYRGLRGAERLYAIMVAEADRKGVPLVCVTDPRNAPMMRFLIGRSFVLVDCMEQAGELIGMVFVRCPQRCQ